MSYDFERSIQENAAGYKIVMMNPCSSLVLVLKHLTWYTKSACIYFSLNLKKENICAKPISKTNLFGITIGITIKLPSMPPHRNFYLSEMKKHHPLQESFNNFNSVIAGV